MKIALLTQSYPPMISGASLFTGRLAEALSKSGHDVLVLAASEREESYREQRGRLTVVRLPSIPNPFRVGQRSLLWPRREVLSALQSFDPDVLHVHDAFQLAIWASRYAWRARRPCIATLHGLPSLVSAFLPLRAQAVVESGLWSYAAWLLRRFDAMVAPTKTTADLFRSRTGSTAKVISCGLDLQTFRPAPLTREHETRLRADLGLPPEAPILLHAGRLDPEKNVEAIIRAAAQVMRASPVHLLVVGDGKARAVLERLCRELGIQARCHFPGYIREQARLAEVYRMADLFSTASCIETQGLVLLEAAACGLPIVAAGCSAVPEIVMDEVNGFLVAPGDTQAMADRMLRILRDPALAGKMRRASHLASLPHDFRRSVDAHETFYNAVLHQHRLADPAAEKSLDWLN